jgi:hypothetical protein
VSGISRSISKIFSKGGRSHPPTPLPTPMAGNSWCEMDNYSKFG